MSQQAWNELNETIETQKQKIEKLKEKLRIAANQLEGVSVAIKSHGQNINTHFFITEYAKMAKEARSRV